ncbi:KICSTOR subunit 2-like [Ruditapes philippinarum]|uniref:KICSTOR subunit 2-like n=1 Tax=Ruditapes philippinarum TaxID=129788 RepID=UPI00295B764F|nr:KICSTOR subunit 2-like [Ruditapes philippinarum]
MDKEKEIHKASFGSSWALMVHSLIQFSVAEKIYMSLGFLEQKWFGRKDTLRNSYFLLLGELRRIEDSVRQQEHIVLGLPGPMVEFELLLSHLCGQLCEYIRARQKTMDFYEQISTMGTNKNMNYQDLVDVIAEIIHVHSKNFHHPILAGLKSSFTYECDVINHLLQSQILMSQAEFLQTLLQLHQSHSKLTSWGSASQAKEYFSNSVFAGNSGFIGSSGFVGNSKYFSSSGFAGRSGFAGSSEFAGNFVSTEHETLFSGNSLGM